MRRLAVLVSVLAAASAAGDEISQAIELGVRHASLQQLDVARDIEGHALVAVQLDDRAVVLDLEPYSVRSPNFKLVLDLGDGVMEEVPAPAPKTLRGRVVGEAGSLAAGTLDDDGLTLMISSGGEMWSVQPVEGEGPGVHAVYSGSDVLEHGGVCGVPSGKAAPVAPTAPAPASDSSTRGTSDLRIAEIAIDADWELFNGYFGQNQNSLLNDVDSILAGVNVIYERDEILTHQLTQVVIRTSSAANPYTTNDPGTLLDQVAAEWNSHQQSVQRDVAHMWTGRNMSGSVIGIAFLGTICTSNGYGADQIRFTSNYNSRVALFSHELGHNWNATHCDGTSSCHIMCSGLGGCNGLGNPVQFGPQAKGQIASFIPSRSCVDNIGVGLPVYEYFDSGSIDPAAWASSTGFDIVLDNSAPSGNHAGRLTPPFMILSTTPLAAQVAPGHTVAVKIWVKPESESTKTIRFNMRDANGANVMIGRIPGNEQGGSYRQYTMQVPGVALNIDTPFSIVPESSGPAWRFDNVEIVEASSTDATIELPLVEDFERAGLFMDRWQPSPAYVNDDEPSPPSGLYSVQLEAGQRMETADVHAAGASDIVFGVLVSSPSDAPGDAALVFEYRDSGGAWHQAASFPAASLPSSGFGVAEVTLPAAAAHNALSVAIEAVGTASADAWRLDDLELGGEPRGGSDCPADLAEPFGVLDLQDISAFVAAFVASDPAADIAAPFGVLDLADVNLFITSFVSGCP
ncbi:MAG: hypothetical protein H6810_07910 [Phycisphaeraceae bacterium]|nr:MAG: hypothetical protein H6810_07910 [Phycisphaeraceae bacterium]